MTGKPPRHRLRVLAVGRVPAPVRGSRHACQCPRSGPHTDGTSARIPPPQPDLPGSPHTPLQSAASGSSVAVRFGSVRFISYRLGYEINRTHHVLQHRTNYLLSTALGRRPGPVARYMLISNLAKNVSYNEKMRLSPRSQAPGGWIIFPFGVGRPA